MPIHWLWQPQRWRQPDSPRDELPALIALLAFVPQGRAVDAKDRTGVVQPGRAVASARMLRLVVTSRPFVPWKSRLVGSALHRVALPIILDT
jgi:hypothetical protein